MAPATRRVLPISDLADAQEATLKLFKPADGQGRSLFAPGLDGRKGHLIEADI